jgi:tetratricopeptide (TPR) repeat protein
VYNGEKYLEECLDSWLSQTYQNFEVVLVDDGSQDHSVEIIQSYIQKDERFKLVIQEHGGISKATERGIKEANSRYIVLMDQDDIALPKRLELTVKCFENGAEIIMGDYEIIDENSDLVNRKVSFPSFINKRNFVLEQLKRNYFLGSAMAFYYKRHIPFNYNSHGVTDYDLSLKMLLNSYQFEYIAETLIHYRVHQNNTSANYSKSKNSVMDILVIYSFSNLFNTLIDMEYPRNEALLALGICYLFQNKLNEAGYCFNNANFSNANLDHRLLEEFDFYSSVYYYKINDFYKSLYFLEKLEKQGSTNPSIYNNIGVLKSQSQDYEASIYWFEKAKGLSPFYQDAVKNLEDVKKCDKGNSIDLRFTERLLRDILTHTSNIIK